MYVDHSVISPVSDCSQEIDGSLQANRSLCGNNASCVPDFSCLCNSGYFSPSGSNTDCRRVNGTALSYTHKQIRVCSNCGNSYSSTLRAFSEGPCALLAKNKSHISRYLIELECSNFCMYMCRYACYGSKNVSCSCLMSHLILWSV